MEQQDYALSLLDLEKAQAMVDKKMSAVGSFASNASKSTLMGFTVADNNYFYPGIPVIISALVYEKMSATFMQGLWSKDGREVRGVCLKRTQED